MLKIMNVYDFAGLAPLPAPVAQSEATGQPMLTNGHLGVDMLYLPPDYAFPLHTHPGDHLLFIIRGDGTVEFDDRTYHTAPGDLFMIEGGVPHAVGAGRAGQWLLAFGAPHKAVDSPDRMTVLDDDQAHALTTVGDGRAR